MKANSFEISTNCVTISYNTQLSNWGDCIAGLYNW